MIRIVHGSDVHFGEPHLPELSARFAEEIRAHAPDLLVVSGDLTQRARSGEFAQARAWFDQFDDLPWITTPGNHDVPLYRVFERLFDPYRNWKRHISEDLDSVVRVPGLTAVALNSASPRTAIVNGRITRGQLDFAREAFRTAPPEDARLLVAHHHLAPAPDYEGDDTLPGARRILEELETMGVEMVCGGHLHRAYIGNSLDVHPGEDRRHGIVIVQSGTTTSRRGRARERLKNSYNVIEIGDETMEILHLLFDPSEGRFCPLSRHTFPRPPATSLPRPITEGLPRAEDGR